MHGVGGTIGAILTGVFASRLINPIYKDAQGNALPVGMIDGNFHQMLYQLVGIGMAVVLAVGGSLVLLKVVDAVIGLRVAPEHEVEGLDLSQHGEEGYYWESSTT